MEQDESIWYLSPLTGDFWLTNVAMFESVTGLRPRDSRRKRTSIVGIRTSIDMSICWLNLRWSQDLKGTLPSMFGPSWICTSRSVNEWYISRFLKNELRICLSNSMSCQGCCIQDEREHPGRKKLGLQTDSRLYCWLRDIAGKIRCKVVKAIRTSYCAGARVPTEHVGSSWQVSNLRLIVVGKTLTW